MDRSTERTVTLLLDAAKLALRGVAGVALSSRVDDDPARAATLVVLWSAAAGEDIGAEIKRLRHVGEEDEP